MALYDGTNAPTLNVYIDVGNRNSGKFILNYSLLGGTDTLGSYTPFSTLVAFNSTEVKSVNIRRGRTREDQVIQPGDLTLVLDNISGNFDSEFVVSQVISSAVGNGSTIVYTSPVNNYKVGQIVSVYNLTTSSFNVAYKTVTAVTSTTFTVSAAVSGTLTGQSGTAYSGYTSSTGDTILIQGTGIRVTATWSGVEYPLYSGFIEQMDKDLDFSPVVTITCVDGLAKIAKMFVKTDTRNLGDRDALVNILTDAGWYGTLAGSPGTKYYLSAIPKGNAMDMIGTIANQELGMFYVDNSNVATWLNWDVFKPGAWASKTVGFVMNDARTSNDQIEYDSITVIGGEKYLTNTVTATNTDGAGTETTFTKFNSTSVGRFGPVEQQIDTYINPTTLDPSAPQNAVQTLADHFASPASRVDQVSFECLGFSSTLWYNFLNTCEMGFAVQVKRITNYGADYTYNGYIQQIQHDITPATWRTTLTLSPGT